MQSPTFEELIGHECEKFASSHAKRMRGATMTAGREEPGGEVWSVPASCQACHHSSASSVSGPRR